MANDPKLVVALEARLDKFEKQLKSAGVIADKQVGEIEDRFARANPQFAGSFLGSFLGNIAASIPHEVIKFVEDLLSRFRELEKVSRLAGIAMNDLFGLQEAAGKLGAPIADVTGSVRNLAVLLDQMKRGDENSLSKLFDYNPAALKGLNRDALTLQQTLQIVANLIQNAASEPQKVDLAKAAGQAESMVRFLELGAGAVAKLQKDAADAAPDLQKLSNLSKDFAEAWASASNKFRSVMVDAFEVVQAKLIELYDTAAKFLTALQNSSVNKFTGLFDFSGDIAKITEVRDQIAALGKDKTAAGAPIREAARAGNIGNLAGTTTRDARRPLSNLPPAKTPAAARKDSLENAEDRIEKRTAALNAEADAVDKGTAAREKARVVAELETVAKQKNGVVTDEQKAKIEQLGEAYGRAAERIEQSRSPLATFARESADINKQLNAFAAESLSNLTSSMADVITGTKSVADAFREMSKSIINDLLKIAIRQTITGPLAGALFGAGGLGGLFGGAGKELPGFGTAAFVGPLPGNASGTDNWRGGPTWVGEKGPEVVNLPRGTQVIPNDVLRYGGGGGGVTVAPVYHIDASGADPVAIMRLERALRESNRSIESRALAAVANQQKRSS